MPTSNQTFMCASIALVSLLAGCDAGGRNAEVVLRVSRDQVDGLSNYDTYKETHAALITSDFVIQAALRDNNINQLPLVRDQADPVSWLQGSISIAVDPSELIRVRMPIGRDMSQKPQVEQILNGVIESYIQEVVDKERFEKVETLSNLRKRYRVKQDRIHQQADEYQMLQNANGATELELLITNDRLGLLAKKQLELELQSIALGHEDDATVEQQKAVIAEQIEFVKQRQQEFVKSARASDAISGELGARKAELEAEQRELATIFEDMSKLEVELERPSRVTVLQRATTP